MTYTHVKLFTLIWTITLTFRSSQEVTTSTGNGEVLDLISNFCLTSDDGSKTKTVHTDSVSKCVILCYMDDTCKSVSYNTLDRVCHVNTISATSVNAMASYDVNCVYAEMIGRAGMWHMAFRATAGLGVSVYDAWNNVGYHDDETSVTPTNYGCLTVDGRLPCDKHFRSRRLDAWDNVFRIKFGFYKESRGGFRVAFRDLSATLTATEAFRASVNMSWVYGNDLDVYNGSFSHFSVEGVPRCLRRFYINQVFGDVNGCLGDTGWAAVIDGTGGGPCCAYESVGPYPLFLYTLTGQPVNWNNGTEVERGDVFAVTIRYVT